MKGRCWKKDNKTRKNEKMAECLHILGHFIVVYDQICCLNVVKCQEQQLNLIPQVNIVWENVFICLCMLFTSKVMTHSVTLLQTVMFRSGTLNGWKWRPWDIISAWYLSDSESRHSKDTKKSGPVKKAGGCAWTPPSSPTIAHVGSLRLPLPRCISPSQHWPSVPVYLVKKS